MCSEQMKVLMCPSWRPCHNTWVDGWEAAGVESGGVGGAAGYALQDERWRAGQREGLAHTLRMSVDVNF